MPLWLNYALLILAVLIWGSLHPVSKLTLAEISPFQLAATRASLACLVLTPICLATGRGSRLAQAFRAAPWTIAAMGVLGFSISLGLSMVALSVVPASLNALFANSTPLFVALFAVTLLREHPSPRALAGVAAGFAGVSLLTLGGAPGGGSLNPLAVAMALTSAAAWGVYTALARRIMAQLDPIAVTALAAAVGAPPLLFAALVWGGGLEALASASPGVKLLLLWVGPVATGLNFTIWALALRRLRTVSVSAFQYMIPVVAMAVAAVLLGEQPSAVVLLGATLVLIGVAATQVG